MRKSIMKYGVFIAMITLSMVSCDAWKEDIRLIDNERSKNLFEEVSSKPELSIFTEILKLTGYDKLLQEAQALTVFAPNNSVLSDMNLSDVNALKDWVGNYIAYLTYYSDDKGSFEVGDIRMINDKNVPVNTVGISGAKLVKFNVASLNGVLHVIDNVIIDRKNIWEYLQTQSGYEQFEFIKSVNERVMDTLRSIQIGLDINARPIYDTVWVSRNNFLDTYPLADENQNFTMLLLEPNAWEYMKTKYSQYMQQDDPVMMEKTIKTHIVADMILMPVEITENGRYVSMSGDSLLVDVNPTAIKEFYQASNGKIYKLNAVDVKMYNNKIKEKRIEAEDYISRWDGQDGWEDRYRSWASGGMDVVLKGTTRNVFQYYVWDTAGDSVVSASSGTRTFQMHHRVAGERFISRSSNSYLKYEPEMYSVPYKIYWRTYDDKSNHYWSVTGLICDVVGNDTIKLFTVNDTDTTLYTKEFPMELVQKLLISFPGQPALTRNANALIENHFSTRTVMAGVTKAGVMDETMLTRYNVAADDKMYMLANSLTANLVKNNTEDAFGQAEILKCPTYGKATFFVSNTTREKDANGGAIFLDYIRLVPQIDPNE